MKLIVNKDRTTVAVGTWGTKNENDYEILEFEFPTELEEYNKRIVYYLGNERVWDTIVDNKAYLTNAITVKEKVKAYVWLTKENTEREADTDFRTKLFEMKFYENDNADGIVPIEQQIDGFNTMLTAMNRKIDEVDALEQTIETAEAERQENENTRISNEAIRQSNESTRQTNEQTRQSQEAERERKTSEAIADIKDKTTEYNANAEAKTTAFNTNATQKTNEFNSNYTQKVNDFNTNATTQKTDFNSNASSKTSAFNSNAETKTNAFNTNATNKTNAFNSNATEKTTAFDNNASTKTSEFNTNAENKTSAFNDNATSKTNDFNDNATEKTTAYNTNAQNKIDEYDEHIVEYQAQIDELQEEVDELSENMPWSTTEQATEISVDDAAKYSKNKLKLFGNTEQASTSIASGDEYDSPSPYHPQPIHVVTGENAVVINGKNFLDNKKISQESEKSVWTYIPKGTYYAKRFRLVSSVNDEFNSKLYYKNKNDEEVVITTKDNDNGNIILNGSDFGWYSSGITAILTLKKGYYIRCFGLNKCNMMISKDSNITSYEPYIEPRSYPLNLGNLELCKIGDYQDEFVKDNNIWKIPNKIVKIDSYNEEAITTPYISTTGGLDIGATIYYVGNEDYTITDETLISQLDAIYEHLKLVKGTNNITVTAEDLAPYMKLTYMQDLKSKLDNLDSRLSLLE